MREEIVQFVWEEQLFNTSNLKTGEGAPILIVDKGEWNSTSGPDFRNATIKIGSSTWVGQVEIHVRASDWYLHQHHIDPAYSNVILHVVVWNNAQTKDVKGRQIPCLSIPETTILELNNAYQAWMNNKGELPCDGYISFTPREVLDSWLADLSEMRACSKLDEAYKLLIRLKGDVLLTELVSTARVLGLPLNEHPMEQLAIRIPWMNVLRRDWKWHNFRDWILSLSGLAESGDFHLNHLWQVQPIAYSLWRWGGMRPSAFPKIRLTQWAWIVFNRFISKRWNSMSAMHSTAHWLELEECPRPGASTLKNWAINLNAFEQIIAQKTRPNVKELLESWHSKPAELNKVTKYFVRQDLVIPSARESQALHHLEKEFCRTKKCVNCAIGRFHFKRAEYDRQIENRI